MYIESHRNDLTNFSFAAKNVTTIAAVAAATDQARAVEAVRYACLLKSTMQNELGAAAISPTLALERAVIF